MNMLANFKLLSIKWQNNFLSKKCTIIWIIYFFNFLLS